MPPDYFLLELANGVAPTATDEETCHFELVIYPNRNTLLDLLVEWNRVGKRIVVVLLGGGDRGVLL